jgi:hypothetical protein
MLKNGHEGEKEDDRPFLDLPMESRVSHAKYCFWNWCIILVVFALEIRSTDSFLRSNCGFLDDLLKCFSQR